MSESITVHRHRTAMVRYALSQPMSLLVRHGLISQATTVFDYGCGQGDDMRALEAQGISAKGWDPHFAPDRALAAAEVVNLGFVLNVIEDDAERRHALKRAWQLTEKVLAVAVMVVGQVAVDGLRPYRDGYLTSRGTFQKYFQHAELRAFIGSVTGAEPVSVTTGIYFVFRRAEDEQEFLLDRGRGGDRVAINIQPRERRSTTTVRIEFAERIPTAIAEIAQIAVHRGRLPAQEELTQVARDELANVRVSLPRAVECCRRTILTDEMLEKASAQRREDLLVHNALCLLNRSRSFQNPGPAIIRDVRALFGNQRMLSDQAAKYLFALSDLEALHKLNLGAASKKIGVLDEKERLVIAGARVSDLPGPLRCYFGCATYLSGEPDRAFIARFDPRRRLLKIFSVEDERAASPAISSTTVVDLRRQKVFTNPESLRLLRKIDVFGGPDTPSRRKRERALQRQLGQSEQQIFASIVSNHDSAHRLQTPQQR
ncbi:hypothetical+protein [Methylocapsa aurea]|uniref:DNA phosphorothioation-associated putative methyltransferase n=1 Tax=Methylocapsa aurea TaxID=663610 RepID=UPI003D18A4EA